MVSYYSAIINLNRSNFLAGENIDMIFLKNYLFAYVFKADHFGTE